MNKKWKRFEQLVDSCFMNMIGAQKDGSCWVQTYEVLREIILEEREKQPDFAQELYQLDEITDYKYNIQEWLQDCIDELDMRGEYHNLLKILDELLEMFRWQEDSPSELRFMKSSVLNSLGRKEESVKFCKEWVSAEPENVVAISASVYANIAMNNFEAAGELIKQHIKEDTECTEDNDIMFTAASIYYQKIGDKKAKKRIDKEIERFEEKLENYFMGNNEEDDFPFIDDEFPFI